MKADDDWIPPPGTTKLKCGNCRRMFASRGPGICASCLAKPNSKSVSPFDPMGSGGGPKPSRKGRSRARLV